MLVIEDNSDARESLQSCLERAGHHVEVAEDGPSGVERAVGFVPEVALIDIGLPGLDGYDVARAIRSRVGGTIFLAAVSGYGQPEDRRRALEAGFDAHLTKPVPLSAIEEILRAAASR